MYLSKAFFSFITAVCFVCAGCSGEGEDSGADSASSISSYASSSLLSIQPALSSQTSMLNSSTNSELSLSSSAVSQTSATIGESSSNSSTAGIASSGATNYSSSASSILATNSSAETISVSSSSKITDFSSSTVSSSSSTSTSALLYTINTHKLIDDGFESGFKFFNSWTNAGTKSVDANTAASGLASLRLERTSSELEFRVGRSCCSDEAIAYTFTNGPIPLRISASVKASEPMPMALNIVCMDENKAWMYGGQQFAQGYATREWAEIENIYTCVSDAKYIGVTVTHKGPVGSVLWLDDVSVDAITINPHIFDTTPVTSERVNLPGINFAGTSVEWPEPWELEYFHQKGMRVIRLPMIWENLQEITNINTPDQAIYGELSELSTTTYYSFWKNAVQNNLTEIDRVVAQAEQQEQKVILNLHNYDRYNDQLITDNGEALANFWSQLARRYRDTANVLFGLMNEPGSSLDSWITHANAAIEAIRNEGAAQPILVYYLNDSIMLDQIRDPLNNIIWEVHHYADSDSSGSHPDCVNQTRFIELLSKETAMFRAYKAKAFLGEFGAGDVYQPADNASNTVCYNAVRGALAYLSINNDVWEGYSWWAAGHIWREFYRNGDVGYMYDATPMLNDQPDPAGTDSPVMKVLDPYL